MENKKVLLITGEGKSWEEYMKSYIHKRYGNQLEFVGGIQKFLKGKVVTRKLIPKSIPTTLFICL
ncbi:hypothetical protein ACQVUL_04420 [Bacillus cytotoxicus]|uniref:Uncharacterized protein n=2 Tax=Bacillus cytotoxicus TaxID=580165 RepID=A0AAX2CDA4_9BACI|nr:hypothetical protein Bcer98_0797 [Bacillus cytotoxicus NVH 391-98]AWC35815.1 hypothetical protein CG481_004675 [Bacillus cytotoxicus]AWC43863.1 hypothetical protein CG479_004595 [Bacillus cytotoxicus]AWC60054.1 hypothetical protein CG474_004745 [Bacillus cytotoxicus]KMT50275.1 hypothetical protein TU51_04490 [Bacillus cytotoxicus]